MRNAAATDVADVVDVVSASAGRESEQKTQVQGEGMSDWQLPLKCRK